MWGQPPAAVRPGKARPRRLCADRLLVTGNSRWTLATLALISIFVSLMVVSTTSELATEDRCPLIHSVWPTFWSGHMALNRVSMLTVAEAGSTGRYGAFNLGQLLGLHGLASLIPLVAVWIIAALFWSRMHQRDGSTPV